MFKIEKYFLEIKIRSIKICCDALLFKVIFQDQKTSENIRKRKHY